MKGLVVYDSVFGNTEKVAFAIGKALGPDEDVGTVKVVDLELEQLAGLEFLLVGSPTRAFNPTKGITSFLKRIPVGGLAGVKVAAFDTRVSPEDVNSKVLNVMVKLFGYAAKPIADRLAKKSGQLVMDPEGFIVTGTEGPLKEGELERAAAWAKEILS